MYNDSSVLDIDFNFLFLNREPITANRERLQRLMPELRRNEGFQPKHSPGTRMEPTP